MLPGEAEALAERSAPAPAAPARVDITIGGRAATVPAEDLQAALDAGAEIAPTAASAGAAGGGLLGSIKAAGVGFAENVGGGLVPAAAGLLGPALAPVTDFFTGEHTADMRPEDYKRAVKENWDAAKARAAQDHAAAYITGGMAGMAADIVGPLGKAAGAMERGAGLGAKALGAGETFSHVLGGAAGAAGTQALYNAGKQISEDTLGDHELNGQKMVAAMTDKDVLLAGALGAGVAGLGSGLGAAWKAFGKAKPGPASAATLDAVAGVEGAGKGLAVEAKLSESTVDAVRRAGMSGDDAAAHVAAVDAAVKGSVAAGEAAKGVPASVEKIIAGAKPEAQASLRVYAEGRMEGALTREAERSRIAMAETENLNKVLRAKDKLDELHFVDRPEKMRPYADPAKFGDALDSVGKMTDRIDEMTRYWDGIEGKGGSPHVVKQLQTSADRMRQVMREVGTPESAEAAKDAITELYGAANQTKRLMDKLGKMGSASYGLQDVVQGARSLADELRPMLEDTAAWGDIGTAHARINEAFSQGGKFEATRQFGDGFGVVLETPGGHPKVELNPAKLEAYLKDAGKETQTFVRDRQLDAMLEHVQGRVRVTRELGMADHPAYAEAEKAVAAVRESMAKAKAKAEALNKLDQLIEESEVHAGNYHGVLGYAAKAYQLYKSPFRQIDALLKVEATRVKFDKAMGGAVKAAVTGEGAPAVAAAAPRTREATVKEIESLKRLSGNPEAMQAKLGAAVPKDLTEAAPRHSKAMAGTLGRMVSFLVSQAPAGKTSRSPLPGVMSGDVRYNDTELARYELVSEAARDPVKALSMATHGNMQREGVEALKQVYPAIYQELRGHVMDQLAELQRKGDLEKMPYQQKVLVGTLLDIVAHDSMEPGFMARMQRDKQAAPGGAKSGAAAPGAAPRPRNVEINTDSYETQAMAISH